MWFLCDGAGITFAVLCHLMLASTQITMNLEYIWGTSYRLLNLVGFNLFSFLAIASHIVCMTTDPGVVAISTDDTFQKLLAIESKEGKHPSRRVCRKCQGPKPSRAHHCSTCNRCVIKMDHHCPWVNNCVGLYNQKHFILFLLYVNLTCVYTGILLICRIAKCAGYAAFGDLNRRVTFSPGTPCGMHPIWIVFGASHVSSSLSLRLSSLDCSRW